MNEANECNADSFRFELEFPVELMAKVKQILPDKMTVNDLFREYAEKLTSGTALSADGMAWIASVRNA